MSKRPDGLVLYQRHADGLEVHWRLIPGTTIIEVWAGCPPDELRLVTVVSNVRGIESAKEVLG